MSKALILSVLVVNFLTVISGYCIAVVNRAVPYLQSEFKMEESLQGWAFNSLLLGSVIGSLFLARQADFRGRRKILSAMALFLLFAIVGTAVTNNFIVFCLFRLLTGIAIGGVTVLVPVFLAEIAPVSVRGRVLLTFPLCLVSGMILAFLADYWLQDTGASNWRYMIISGAFPAILFFLFRIFLPESPRFLMQKGLEQETDIVIERIDPGCDRFHFREGYKRTVSLKTLRHTSELFKPPVIRSVLLSILTGMFIVFSGINAVSFSASKLASSEGMTQESVSWPALIIGFVSLVSLTVAMRIIDKAGRRRLLILGNQGLTVCLFLLGIIVLTGFDQIFIHALILLLFFIFFSFSLGGIPWVILPELFHNTARIRGVSYGVASFWLFSLAASLIVQATDSSLVTGISFLVYGSLSLAGFLFLRRNIPETKGIALEDIGSGRKQE